MAEAAAPRPSVAPNVTHAAPAVTIKSAISGKPGQQLERPCLERQEQEGEHQRLGVQERVSST